MSVSTQKAYEIGQNGGTVKTNGLPYQQKERIDSAVNKGSADRGNK